MVPFQLNSAPYGATAELGGWWFPQGGYRLKGTLAEHTAAVTAIRFTAAGGSVISAGADKAVRFRPSPGATGGVRSYSP